MNTLYNVCAVSWGVQYPGGVQCHGDIMMHVGDILSTVGMLSIMGNIMMHMAQRSSTSAKIFF